MSENISSVEHEFSIEFQLSRDEDYQDIETELTKIGAKQHNRNAWSYKGYEYQELQDIFNHFIPFLKQKDNKLKVTEIIGSSISCYKFVR
jgi:hypothetical protein